MNRLLDNRLVRFDFPYISFSRAADLVETFCTIMDLKNVSFGNAPAAIEYVKMASKISQNYYPERLGKLYIINASWAFTSIWYGIKGARNSPRVRPRSSLRTFCPADV